MIKERIQKGLRPAFERDRVICRLIAAWSVFVLLVLAGAFTDGKPDFTLLAFAQQVSLFHLLWCTALFFLLFSCVAVLIPAWHTDSWFMFAGATVCVLIWLSAYPTSQNGTLFVLACFAVYALFVISTLHRNEALLDRWRPSARTVTILAVAGGVLSCIVISAITCLRYRTFSAPNFDFELFCNMFHNMREKGLPLVTSERDRLLSHFAVHISPIYYLLLPFYFVFPSPLTLQIGQAVVLTSGVIPVILLARHYRLSGKVTLLVSLLYSFYPAMSTGCFYDIHENCFLLPILLWLFYFFEREKYLPMYISAVLLLLVKEDAAVYLIFFAVYVLLSRRRYLHGAVLCAMAIAYFALSAYLLNTFGLGMMVNRFDNLIYDKESGLLGAVRTAFFNPGYLLTQMFTTDGGTWQKLEYLIILLLPLAAIPFCTRKASRWLLCAPLLINLLTYYQYQYNVGFQYHFGIAAFLFYAAIQNLADLKLPTRRNLLSLAAAACCCFYVFSVLPTLYTYSARWEEGKETYRQMEEILDTLPEDASLCVSTMLLAHVADRDTVYEVAYHDATVKVDYVVLDARYQNCDEYRQKYENYGYTVKEEHPGLIIILESAR